MINTKDVLFTFDSFVNTDIGLAKLIKDKYKNVDIFDESLFELTSDEIIDLMLLNEGDNPMDILLNKSSRGKVDSEYLYNSFIENEEGYKDILLNSMFNNVLKMIQLLYYSKEVRPTILCENSMQQSLLLNNPYFKPLNIDIEVCDINKFDYSKYGSIYIGKLNSFKDIVCDDKRPLKNKMLFVLMSYFNTVKTPNSTKRTLPEWLIRNHDCLSIKIFDPYEGCASSHDSENKIQQKGESKDDENKK